MIDAYAKGIDISEWQGDIDLSPYQDQFVIIRAGYSITEDKQFRNNVNKCLSLGIPYGVYWFSEALLPATAGMEADACLKTISGLDPDLGVWIDMESSAYKNANGFRPDLYAGEISRMFCQKMQDSGYYAGVYCSKSWIKYITPACDAFDKWIASWGSNDGNINDDTSEYGTILQYTSRLNGKSLDGDICYIDIDQYDSAYKPHTSGAMDHDMLIKCMAYLTIAGLFGNGEDRRRILGDIYDEIQMEVNRIYEN